MKDNQIIAEFMGVETTSDATNSMYHYEGNSIGRKLQYHNSWDWLIPVANEIIKSRDEQNADWDLTDLKYALQTTNIEYVYKAVVKFITYNESKKIIMKVKIQQRSVYHKFTEIEIEVPNLIDYESEIHDYLTNNEDLWSDEMDAKFEESEYEFGSGVHDYEGMNESNSDSEWRFQCPNGYGGHL